MATLRRHSQELQARRAQKEDIHARRERALADAWRREKAQRATRAKEARRQQMALWRERKEQPAVAPLSARCEPGATVALSSTDDLRDLSEGSRTSPRRSERGQEKSAAPTAAPDSTPPQRHRMPPRSSTVLVSPRLQALQDGATALPPGGAASTPTGRRVFGRRPQGAAVSASESAPPPLTEAVPPVEASQPSSPRRRGSGSLSPRAQPAELPPLISPASARQTRFSRRDAAAPGTPVHTILSELTEQREHNRKDRLRREQQRLLDESLVVAYKDYMRNHFRKILALTEMPANKFPYERRTIGNLGKPLTPQQEKLAATQDSGWPRRVADGSAEAPLPRAVSG